MVVSLTSLTAGPDGKPQEVLLSKGFAWGSSSGHGQDWGWTDKLNNAKWQQPLNPEHRTFYNKRGLDSSRVGVTGKSITMAPVPS